METYVKPILNDDTENVLISRFGCNDTGNKQLTENKIAEKSNACDVFVSSLICKAQKRLNDKLIAATNILKHVCKLNGLGFIE